MQPHKITILRNMGGGFTVVAVDCCGREPLVADTLTFDEMLGCVARATMPCDPVTGERINLPFGRQLFLSPPEKKHPDAAGDAAPRVPDWAHLAKWTKTADGGIDAHAAPGCSIDEAAADAIRLCLSKDAMVRLCFNGKTYRFQPSTVLNAVLK